MTLLLNKGSKIIGEHFYATSSPARPRDFCLAFWRYNLQKCPHTAGLALKDESSQFANCSNRIFISFLLNILISFSNCQTQARLTGDSLSLKEFEQIGMKTIFLDFLCSILIKIKRYTRKTSFIK